MKLIVTTYTQPQMVEIFNTTRMDSIKRSLNRLGYKYEVEGRGKKALFHITETPSDFRAFAINELGFAPQTNFEALEAFMMAYFCDENFCNLMVVDMVETLKANYEIEVSQPTLGRWIKKMEEMGLTHASIGDFSYFSTFAVEGERETVEITEQQFKDAWSAYWTEWHKDHNYNDAFAAMAKVSGAGKVYKVSKRETSAFNLELVERIVALVY